MAGISYTTLVTQIRNYTETDSNVLTTDILENIILNAQYRIMRDIPIDADRKQQLGNLGLHCKQVSYIAATPQHNHISDVVVTS